MRFGFQAKDPAEAQAQVILVLDKISQVEGPLPDKTF